MSEVDLPPDDDAFVTTALSRLPVPEHGPDFWDVLAGRLDDAADELYLERVGAAAPVALLERHLERLPEPEPELEPPLSDATYLPFEDYEVLPFEEDDVLTVDLPVAPAAAAPRAPAPLEVDPSRYRLSPFPVQRPPTPPPAPMHRARPSRPARPGRRPEPLRAAAHPPQPDVAGAAGPMVFGRPSRPPRVPAARPTDRRPGSDLPGGDRIQPGGVVHDLAVVPRALRRRSNVVLVTVAVVAAAMVVVAGATLVRQRSGSGTPEAGSTTGDVTSTSFVAANPLASGATGAEDPAAQAVLAWVADLAAGDVDGAWEALGPRSQRHFGSRSELEADMIALSEGYGAWAATSPELVIVTPLLTDGDASISVVTLVGTLRQEGRTQQRADAFPVRSTGGRMEIEPYAEAGAITIVRPLEGAQPDATDDVVVDLPEEIGAAVIRIDQGSTAVCGISETARLDAVAGKHLQRCTYTPERGSKAGPRLLTVAYASPDGTKISAKTVRYQAA